MDKAEEREEKLIKETDHAFAVLGDGWQMDKVMGNMFDECIEATKKYAQRVSREELSEAFNAGKLFMFYRNVPKTNHPNFNKWYKTTKTNSNG